METQFKDERTGCTIYAPLGGTLIHATMRACDLIPAFLNAIRDTAEYAQIMQSINGANWNMCVITDAGASDTDERWDSEDISYFLNETLWDIMNSYAPEGYYFGSHPGDGSDYGYWTEEFANIQV